MDVDLNEKYLEESLVEYLSVALVKDIFWREKFRSHGGVKVPGAAGRPWSRAAGSSRAKAATSGNYHKTHFLRDSRCLYKVSG